MAADLLRYPRYCDVFLRSIAGFNRQALAGQVAAEGVRLVTPEALVTGDLSCLV